MNAQIMDSKINKDEFHKIKFILNYQRMTMMFEFIMIHLILKLHLNMNNLHHVNHARKNKISIKMIKIKIKQNKIKK